MNSEAARQFSHEALIDRFERAWRSGTAPDVGAFLSQSPAGDAALAWELIALDLEYRWRRDDAPKWILEEYAARLSPFLSGSSPPAPLIAEEYRVRRRWGDHPDHSEYVRRFAAHADALPDLLRAVDRDLEDEFRAPLPRQSPPHVRDPQAPLPLTDFLIQRHLGSGGMGRVYKALQRSLDRDVAIKFLRKSYVADADVVERFRREAHTVARLRHPGIVGVHGLGRTPPGGYFIVMDLIPGPDLAAVAAAGPVTAPQAVTWALEASHALEYAHRRGIVHCDLKPANLLLDEGRVVVTDFGLAQPITANPPVVHAPAGTAGYMAPEQIDSCCGLIGPATDVYGLGAVLYALLAGRPPHTGRSLADVLANTVSGIRPAPLAALRPDVPAELDVIVRRCLEKEPGGRFPTARDLAEALEQVPPR